MQLEVDNMNRIKIFNARVITPYRIIMNGCIIIEDNKIMYVGEDIGDIDKCVKIDADGNYASPGFIDIHTHGGGGHDFMDGTVESYLGAAEKHAQHGTTSMLPTTLACADEELKSAFQVFKAAKLKNTKGAELLGLHLEGPYFAMNARGALDPRYIRDPKREEYEKILSWSDDIVRWSAAPELEGALEFGRYLKSRGILASIGHTDAVFEQAVQAYENGYTHITHLYSCTSTVKRINAYRYAGVLESAFLYDDVTVEIIADGVHLPESLLRLIYKIKGADNIALVTDSMRAAGMPGRESIIGSLKNGQRVIVEDGVAKLPDRTAFAGSVATADRLVRTMIDMAGVPLADAVKMMALTPARIIGVDKYKGSLTAGKDADIVIFDDNVNIHRTFIRGKTVYEKEADKNEK